LWRSAMLWILGATVAQDLYGRIGWRFDLRLSCWCKGGAY
jgi:hypothetical protein